MLTEKVLGEAQDGLEAIAKGPAGPWDVIVLDIETAPDDLLRAISAVMAGEQYVGNNLSALLEGTGLAPSDDKRWAATRGMPV
jgi:hypothetical protein